MKMYHQRNKSNLTKKQLQKAILLNGKQRLSIYSSPFTCVYYFVLYIATFTIKFVSSIVPHLLFYSLVIVTFYTFYYNFNEFHKFSDLVLKEIYWYGYWAALGIASSVGLGSGLHTFIMFLAPFIAEVVITSYKCHSLDFVTRGQEKFTCLNFNSHTITAYSLFNKVYKEALFWGLGTAIGELPPYFISRTAARNGTNSGDNLELEQIKELNNTDKSLKSKILYALYLLLEKTGFVGIFLCASIPNPLFDVAGILCGQFQVPFWTFFGAVFLGKAVVKASLQTFAIILLFSKEIQAKISLFLYKHSKIAHRIFNFVVNKQSTILEATNSSKQTKTGIILSFAWNGVITVMMIYFVLSIIESFALEYQESISLKQVEKIENSEK